MRNFGPTAAAFQANSNVVSPNGYVVIQSPKSQIMAYGLSIKPL
jgi:hypothetical protein